MPHVALQRTMSLKPAVEARNAGATRPPWSAIFAKAYALAAAEMPALRRAYLRYPWPHFYEYPACVASLTVDREYEGESVILGRQIKDPAALSLAEIGRRVTRARDAPVEEIKEFRQALRLARLPLPLRRLIWWFGMNVGRQRANFFGTYGVAAIPIPGTEILHARTTWPAFIGYAYGTLNEDGALKVVITWDHRVFDAGTAGRALARIEEIINGPIAEELRS
jgi:hypothetical protein